MASIKADRIIDQWMTVIENGAGQGEQIYTNLMDQLQKAHLPGVSWRKEQVTEGLMGKGREFLVVRHSDLREYTMFVFARNIGAHLDCGWFLTVQPKGLKRALSKQLTGNPIALSQNIGVFSQEDLSAWTHIVHRTYLRIIKEVMGELEQDVTGMNTTSKGYLSVW